MKTKVSGMINGKIWLKPVFLAAALAILNVGGCGRADRTMPITTDSPEALDKYMQANELIENIRVSDAQVLLEEALELDPKFAMAHFSLCLVSDNDAERQKHLRHAADLAVRASKGEQLVIETVRANLDGDYDRGFELTKKVAEMYPDDVRAYWRLGMMYNEREQYDDAVATLKQALRLDKNFAPAYNNLGYIYRGMGEYKLAEKAFRTYIKLIPEEANPYDSMADLYMKMGRFDDAIAHYKMAIEKNPEFTISQRKIGTSYAFKGQYEEARANYRLAYEIEPTNNGRIEDLFGIAKTYIMEERYEEACDQLDEVREIAMEVGLDARVAQYEFCKALIYIYSNELDNALNQLGKAEKLVKEYDYFKSFQMNAGYANISLRVVLLALQGNLGEAEEAVAGFEAKLNKDDRDMVEVFNGISGILNYFKGDYESAAEQLAKSEPNNTYWQYYLGMALLESGNTDDAREVFENLANFNDDIGFYAFNRNRAIAKLASLE
ncbi:MAG: tetratricopeptide repeat protein [Candidatus Marinimicrobia bacterium]|nr:tetratricopeptide repeat protein [Candidatus Neomarinimicrobiota bacterium]